MVVPAIDDFTLYIHALAEASPRLGKPIRHMAQAMCIRHHRYHVPGRHTSD
jgi:hypothetical protein